MKIRIHVNQHDIRARKPKPLRIKTYHENTATDEVRIMDKAGNLVATVVYRPDRPLSCGARCWIELSTETGMVGYR